MRASSTIRMWRRATGRWWQWCRRHAWYAALLIILCFGLVEPFGCIAHCWLQLPTGAGNNAGMHHAHQHGGTSSSAPKTWSQPASASSLRAQIQAANDSRFETAQQGVPVDPSDRPSSGLLHEHLLALLAGIALIMGLLVHYPLSIPPRAPPWQFYRPPLRPPIRFAPSR